MHKVTGVSGSLKVNELFKYANKQFLSQLVEIPDLFSTFDVDRVVDQNCQQLIKIRLRLQGDVSLESLTKLVKNNLNLSEVEISFYNTVSSQCSTKIYSAIKPYAKTLKILNFSYFVTCDLNCIFMIKDMYKDSNIVKISHECKHTLILNQTVNEHTQMTTTYININKAYHAKESNFFTLLTFTMCVKKLILHKIDDITSEQLHKVVEINTHLKTIILSGCTYADGSV
jgi:hypothetical protein